MNSKLSLSLFIIILISSVKSDLPLHCKKSQVVGDWTLELTESITSDKNEMVPCGHHQPDHESTSLKAMEGTFKSGSSLDLSLKEDDTVYGKISGSEKHGQWTMIYDEGFEINYGDYKFFTFNKYTSSGFEFESLCDQTLVGWYNNLTTGQKGCMRGYKPGSSGQSTKNIKQDKVVQPKKEEKQEKKDTSTSDVQFIDQNIMQQTEPVFDSEPLIFTQQKTFLGEKKEDLDLHKGSSSHEEVVKRLNQLKSTWTAKVPEEFKDFNLGEMNQRAGRIRKQAKLQQTEMAQTSETPEHVSHPKKQKIAHHNKHPKNKHLNKQKKQKKNTAKHLNTSFIQTHLKEDLSDLPQNYSWEEYLNEAIQQQDCGSCYAIATSEMISTRLKIKYGEDVRISAQHSLDCNYYNQGCDGGYGFLVSKFGSEYDMVREECHPYKARNGKCEDSCDVSKEAKTYRVQDYQYIGGAYGKSTERAMMEEIYENGPIVVSFEPNYDFMYYSEGIYQSVDSSSFLQAHEKKPEWEKVDHSVLAYGWGEENGVKYWEVLNSWGKNWGVEGTFRIRRGIDESHIESMGEAATPYIVTK